MNIKEIVDTVLEFLNLYHIWFILGLFILSVILLVLLCVTAKKTHHERVYSAELANKNLAIEDGYKIEKEKLLSEIKAKDIKLSEKCSDIDVLSERAKSLDESKAALEAALEEKEANLEAANADTAKLMEEVATLSAEKMKLVNELKSTKVTLADANAKYDAELNAITESKGALAEEFSKFQIENAEKISNLKDELKHQKEINDALVIAVHEIGGKKEVAPAQPAEIQSQVKADKMESLKRNEIISVAKSLGIDGCYKMKKDDIIDAIKQKLNKEKTSRPKKK